LLGTYLQMDTQGMISVKAKFQNEIRRFALPAASSWTTLETTLGSLFSISEPIVVKYLDDEDDLCTISSQDELNFAIAMQKSPLRIHIFQVGSPKQQEQVQAPLSLSSSRPRLHPNAPAFQPAIPPALPPQFEKPTPCQKGERMQAKLAQLEEKKKTFLSALSDESLNSEKRRVMTWKVQKIEEKINVIELRRDKQLEKEKSGFPRHGLADQPGHWGRGRGGCGGRGRGGRGRDQGDPILLALTQEARPRIMEARRNGDEAAEHAIQMEVLQKFQEQLSLSGKKETPM